ncbi:MAG TPA: hypothetical protein VE685_18845 [Thermoanaerobaculia bacterium]|nr:hypothetical protein [Thermoanaerobaculia bacterium]
MEPDAPRTAEEKPEDGVPSGGIEIVDLAPLPPPSPRLVRIENRSLPEKLEIKPGESVTWELDVDPGVTVGIAFRSSPLDERGRFGPFSSVELGGFPLENGKHRVRITGFYAKEFDLERSYDYALTVRTQKEGETLETEDPQSGDVTGQLMVDKSGRPPGAGPWDRPGDWPRKPGEEPRQPWQRVFLKIAPAPAAAPDPGPAPGD